MQTILHDRIAMAMSPKIIYARDFSFLTQFFDVDNGELWWNGPEWSGLDIETEVAIRLDKRLTTGLNPHNGEIATVQVEIDGVVWVVHWSSSMTLASVSFVEWFQAYLESPVVTKAIHKSSFELKWFLKTFGLALKPEAIWDTQIGEYDLAEGRGHTSEQGRYWVPVRGQRPKLHLSLGSCIERRYGYIMDKGTDVRLSFTRGESLTPRQRQYAAEDAIWARVLGQDQWEDMYHLEEEQHVPMRRLMALDCAAAEAVARMELVGMPMDFYDVGVLYAEYHNELHELEEKVRQAFWLPGDGEPLLSPTGKQRTKNGALLIKELNLNSGPQMIPRLNEFGIPINSYEADEIKHYKDNAGVASLLRFKKLSKLVGTYILPFANEHIHPNTRRIYCNLNLTVTTTSRLSSDNPNLQNIPIRGPDGARVRSLFAPKPPNLILEADFSNIELKLIAEIFKDENMKRAFKMGLDLHALIGAAVVYNIRTNNLDELLPYYEKFIKRLEAKEPEIKGARQSGKPVNFGLGYGAGPGVLQATAWRDYDIWFTEEEAKDLRQMWLGLYWGVRQHHYQSGQVLRNATGPIAAYTLEGRRRWIDPHSGYSEYLNFPIQGTSAEMTKRALNAVKRDLNIIMVVHDSIMAEVNPHEAEDAKNYLHDAMVKAGEYYLKEVPVTVDAKLMASWIKE